MLLPLTPPSWPSSLPVPRSPSIPSMPILPQDLQQRQQLVHDLHLLPPPPPLPLTSVQDPQQRQKLVQDLHLLKTDIFMQLVEGGAMPLRPGVRRLVRECEYQ